MSDAALEDAIWVAALFNVVDRVADALGFTVPAPEQLEMGAPMMLHGGYKMA